MTYRLRNIGIAVALALIAVLLVLLYITDYKRTVQNGEEQVGVYVAAENIPAGMSGAEALSQQLLEKRQVERRNLAPGWIANDAQLKNLVASQTVYAGEQATTQLFRADSEKGVRSQLSGNLRAFQLPGTSSQLLQGTLKAGDHVDVVVGIKYKLINLKSGDAGGAGEDFSASRVALRDILVLRGPASNAAQSKLTNPNEQQSVLLALTDAQAQKLFFAQKYGDWTLQLRPTTDAADSPESVETTGSMLADGLSGRQIHQLITGR